MELRSQFENLLYWGIGGTSSSQCRQGKNCHNVIEDIVVKTAMSFIMNNVKDSMNNVKGGPLGINGLRYGCANLWNQR